MSKLVIGFTYLIFIQMSILSFAQTGTIYFVSENGSDRNSGTITKPFATPNRAITMANKSVQRTPGETVTIYFRKGTYFCSAPFRIENAASKTVSNQVVLSAYNKEEVIFHGGKKLDGGKFKLCSDKAILSRLLPEAIGKVREIDLIKEGIKDFGTLKQHGFGIIPEPSPLELFINGAPQFLARYPNEGILKIGKVIDKGSIPRNGDFSNRGAEFGYEYDRPIRWKNADDIWLHGKFSFGYNDDHFRIAQIDSVKKTFKVVQPHIYGVCSSLYASSSELAGLSVRGYYVYNLLEEIDKPGEYYLDRNTGKLYIYSSDILNASDIEVSLKADPFFIIKDASRITIKGITFSCSRGMGIYLENATDITIDQCTFSNLGTVAISMGHQLKDNENGYNVDGSPKQDQAVKGKFNNIAINNCLIFNTGCGGIIVEGGDRKALISGNNMVYNTEFYQTDRINNSYSPSISLYGVGNIVRNCYFHNLRHQSIGFMGNDLLIEYCRFDRVCTDADDMGTVYTGRNPSARGTIIQYNYFSNIVPKDKGTSMCGIYLDDGSGGMLIKNNFFYRVGNPGHYQNFAAIFMHGCHDNILLNNIFMDCPVAVGHGAWNDEGWMNSLKKPLMKQRLSEEVNIMGETYQKRYPELKNYFTEFGKRLNLVQENILIRSQTAQFGDLMLRKNISIDDVDILPEKIDFTEIRKQLPSIEPFPFERVGVIRSMQ